MKKYRKYFVIVFLLFLIVGYSIALYSMKDASSVIVDDTVVLTATVKDVQINEAQKDKYIKIYIDKYFSYLLISPPVADNLEIKDYENITPSSNIKFRILKNRAELIDTAEFTDIVELVCENEIVFSIDDYNSFLQQPTETTFFAGIILIVVLILLTVVYVRKSGVKIRGRLA